MHVLEADFSSLTSFSTYHRQTRLSQSSDMGFETVQHALAFVEELAAGAEACDTATIGQQLRDLDVYLQHVLTPKVRQPH